MASYIALFALLAPFASAAPLGARPPTPCYAIKISEKYGYLRDTGGPIGFTPSIDSASRYYFPASLNGNGGLAQYGGAAHRRWMYLTYNLGATTREGAQAGRNRGNVVAVFDYSPSYPLLKATKSDATHFQFRDSKEDVIVSLKVCSGENGFFLSVGAAAAVAPPNDFTQDTTGRCVDVGDKFEVTEKTCVL